MKGKGITESTNQTQTPGLLIPEVCEPFSTATSLYIHIPFCTRKCIYCDFFSVPFDESLTHAYADALCQELYLKSQATDHLKTVYIGGGTPSLLPDVCCREIFSCLRDHYLISHDTEITVEANPGSLDQSKTNLFLELGVNRISLGVQSFNDHELTVLGRIHSVDDALRSFDIIRNSGLLNVSVDLMYGIPGQSMDSWRETVTKAVECSPMHISTYELTFEEGTPICKVLRKPEEELIVAMYNHAIDSLTGYGYDHYEISNFAQSGFSCAHNLNYWDRGGYIGVGAGAHSFVDGIRSHNVQALDGYIKLLNSDLIPEAASMRPSPAEILKEFLFLRLRKIDGISIREANDLGLDIVSAGKELLEGDFLEVKDGTLRLTRKGIVLSNSVNVRIFENLGL